MSVIMLKDSTLCIIANSITQFKAFKFWPHTQQQTPDSSAAIQNPASTNHDSHSTAPIFPALGQPFHSRFLQVMHFLQIKGDSWGKDQQAKQIKSALLCNNLSSEYGNRAKVSGHFPQFSVPSKADVDHHFALSTYTAQDKPLEHHKRKPISPHKSRRPDLE